MDACERVTLTDKNGDPFELTPCGLEDLPRIIEMYDHYDPMPASQGLPPPDPDTRLAWVRGLLERGINLLARRGDKVIGHAALLPDFSRHDCEFVIFIDRHDRNCGVGTEMTRYAFDTARASGLTVMFLTVEVFNFLAIGLYRKLGFNFCDTDDCERTMSLCL